MALPLLPILGGLFSGLTSLGAANAQKKAAGADLAFQKDMFNQILGFLAPYREGGETGQAALLYEMGLGPKPADYQGFQATPGYDFRMQQGTDAVQASAAARGGLNSGATLMALQDYGQNQASQEYGNYFNRLAGIAGAGQNAAAMAGNAGQNLGNAASSAYGAMGNAASAGITGFGNALQGGLGNAYGMGAYQNALANPTGSTGPVNPWTGF